MKVEGWVGLRYLTAPRNPRAPSVVTSISVFAVSVGVVIPILVLSVMGGFESDLRVKILSSRAHLLVTGADAGPLEDPGPVLEVLDASPDVLGASPFVESDVMASSPTNYSGIVLRGIEPERLRRATTVGESIIDGSLDGVLDPSAALQEREERLGGVGRGGETEALLQDTRESVEDLRRELDALEQAIEAARERRSELRGDGDGSASGEGEGSASGHAGDAFGVEGERSADDAGGRIPPPIGADARRMPPPIAGSAGGPPPTERVEAREPPGIVIGSELRETLRVDIGDVVQLINPDGDVGPMGPVPRSWPHRIVGVFHTGLYEFDNSVVYVAIDDARAFLNVPDDEVTGIEVRTDDVQHADTYGLTLAAQLEELGRGDASVRDWKELNRNLFAALKLEKLVMAIVLFIIVFVSGFAVASVLVINVIRRRDDIAILRTVGASKGVVQRIFVAQGASIGLMGTALGLVVAGGFLVFLLTAGFPLNPEVYYIDRLPVDVDGFEIFAVVTAAVSISSVATILPAMQAARLDPAQGLRNE